MMRAIFLDRDGVICENRADYVKSWAEFAFIPEALTSLQALSQLNLPIVVVTNQSAVGRGIMAEETVHDIHQRMLAEISRNGGRVDKVYYCPHQPQANCACRKPKAGMLEQAAAELGINLSQSYMVGDALTDIQAGHQAGCQTFLVLSGRGRAQLPKLLETMTGCFTIGQHLADVTAEIKKRENYA